MKNSHSVSSVRVRPLALVGGLLVLCVTSYGLLVGCGSKAQETGASAPDQASQSAPAAQPAADTGSVANIDPLVLGAKVYRERCVLCHGPEGKGDGPAAAGLNPKPRNHSDGTYMKSRTDEELLGVIRVGKGGMPAWGNVLSEQEIQAVLKHVRTLAK